MPVRRRANYIPVNRGWSRKLVENHHIIGVTWRGYMPFCNKKFTIGAALGGPPASSGDGQSSGPRTTPTKGL